MASYPFSWFYFVYFSNTFRFFLQEFDYSMSLLDIESLFSRFVFFVKFYKCYLSPSSGANKV